jgi:hypothetical protein
MKGLFGNRKREIKLASALNDALSRCATADLRRIHVQETVRAHYYITAKPLPEHSKTAA